MSRGSVYYPPQPSAADLALMRGIDQLHLEHPFMGGACCAISYIARASRLADVTWPR